MKGEVGKEAFAPPVSELKHSCPLHIGAVLIQDFCGKKMCSYNLPPMPWLVIPLTKNSKQYGGSIWAGG